MKSTRWSLHLGAKTLSFGRLKHIYSTLNFEEPVKKQKQLYLIYKNGRETFAATFVC